MSLLDESDAFFSNVEVIENNDLELEKSFQQWKSLETEHIKHRFKKKFETSIKNINENIVLLNKCENSFNALNKKNNVNNYYLIILKLSIFFGVNFIIYNQYFAI